MTFHITLPLPPRVLSPNHTVGSRGGRMAKASATKKYRTRAKVEYMATYSPSIRPRAAAGTVQVTWYAKTRRFPDGDNALATMKAAFDGLTDVGLFCDDRGLTHKPVIFAVSKDNPRVLLTIEI